MYNMGAFGRGFCKSLQSRHSGAAAEQEQREHLLSSWFQLSRSFKKLESARARGGFKLQPPQAVFCLLLEP